ncbi:glycosyl hydrolase family 18 protein [Paenibacillus koleovorans]|uniref:glycosyl hydrolase family 18 protein n=1 Tax=Paenibacillus koleovorans TaxID=121608 RepID=UPI001FE7B938|nr:glycosyl hydrolase family 18 protein [Paenibacillus koleovorans]
MELTATEMRRVRPPRRGAFRFWIIFSLLLLVAASAGGTYYWFSVYYPSSERAEPDLEGKKKPIYFEGAIWKEEALGTKEGLKLPLSLIRDKIDPTLLYEAASDSVIITTKDKVIQLKTNMLTGMLNDKPITLRFPVEKSSGSVFLPIESLRTYYGLDIRESEESGIVMVYRVGQTIQWATVSLPNAKPGKTVALRKSAGIKFPIVADLQPEEQVSILYELDEWYLIQRKNGITGYVQKKHLAVGGTESIPTPKQDPPFVPWKPAGGKINMTWEHVTTKNPNTAQIGPMPGLNVISPTWFHLLDGEGNIKNYADAAYVKWAQSNNYQVWALFDNNFDPAITTEALSTHERRLKMIKQLLSFAQMYKLQGINIDFENVNLKDKANLTQFIREMAPLLHEQGLVLSMDVTVKSSSENWSMFYDRQALNESLDYMMVMAYDEHYAASPVAGSVSSLTWVEKSIVQIMKEDKVPPSKLVLGIPFYTRIWTEQMKDGKPTVSSRAVFMETAWNAAKDKKLTPVFLPEIGQNYVEYKEGEALNKIWLEDEVSVKARIELVKKYDLAGVASWRRGYEAPAIWDLIQTTLESKP